LPKTPASAASDDALVLCVDTWRGVKDTGEDLEGRRHRGAGEKIKK
jgi:hypothetical protein